MSSHVWQLLVLFNVKPKCRDDITFGLALKIECQAKWLRVDKTIVDSRNQTNGAILTLLIVSSTEGSTSFGREDW